MRVAFRTDASLEIGTGHVMRCLTLARALRDAGADCHFIIRTHPDHLGDRIVDERFAVELLPAPGDSLPDGPPAHAHWAGVAWAQDAAETRAALNVNPPDWLVVDHYSFDARWEQAARADGTQVMVIDDLADRLHDCDLLLDQNFGHEATDYDGLVPDRCVRLMGPRYALLRSEFREARASALAERADRGLQHLLITMGGVDAVDATSTVLIALRDAALPEGLRITVIMGSSAPALDRVRTLAQDMPWPTEVAVNVSDMAARMAVADLAIGAGGSTTWERCCLGLPSIIEETADNQAGIAQAMMAVGAAFDPGPLSAPDFAQKLNLALAEASDPTRLDEMSGKAAAICDGKGAARVTSELVSNISNKDAEFRVRPAQVDDAKDVWIWRNAGCASKYYRSQTPTELDAHIEWFRRALKDPDRLMLIVENESMRLGHVRIDQMQGQRDQAEISVYVNPDCRGQGYGKSILKSAMAFATKESKICRFLAEIHNENRASLSIFQKAGFCLLSCDEQFCRMTTENTDQG